MPLWYSKIRSYTRTTSPGNSFFPPGARLPSSMWYRTVSSVAFFTRQYTTNHGACWLRKPLHCDFPRYIVKPEYSKKLGEWKWLVAVRSYRSFAWNIFFQIEQKIFHWAHYDLEISNIRVKFSSVRTIKNFPFVGFCQVNRTEISRTICTTSLRAQWESVRTYKQVS